MPKLKPGTIIPTPEEDTKINAGIAADIDSPEWTNEDFARSRPASEMLPQALYAKLIAKRPASGPKPAKAREQRGTGKKKSA
jgi:hypothetical protein